MGKRIYGEKISVSTEEVKAFWRKRASLYEEKGISAVICGDQNAERANRENEFDREHIIPQLGLTQASRVIDMGCGVGRLTKMLLPQCGHYCGVDYSEEMLKVTDQVCKQLRDAGPQAGTYGLYHLSFLEAAEKGPDFFGGRFDIFVMMSICMYINDEELERAFKLVPRLMNDRAVILLQESMGLNQRLTLDRISSDALQTSYSAIYRTREEYFKLYEPLFEAGFAFAEEAQMPNFGNAYPDSERRFCIMKRG